MVGTELAAKSSVVVESPKERTETQTPKSTKKPEAKVPAVALPLSVVIRLLTDQTFQPGARPDFLDIKAGTWLFKETVAPGRSRLAKRSAHL